MEAVAWIVAGVAGLVAAFFFVQWNSLKGAQATALPAGPSGKTNPSPTNDLDKKLEALRGELASAREEAQRNKKQLEEAREEAKKKLRREGKKAEREAEQQPAGPDARDMEIQGLKKGLSSLESQLNTAKRDAERATAELERLQGSARGEADGARKARDEERNRNQTLVEENAALKKTLEELRAARKKDSERPEIPGTALDLKGLPVEAVQELARYFRKGEEFERLYNVSQGQIQLAQDRYMELQRRYFAVCRELAVAAGTKPGSDDEARKTAEGVVSGTETVARAAQATTSGGAEAAGEGARKRRRRRRKRKPGALEGAAGAEGADAADETGADTDGGDDDIDDMDVADDVDEGAGSAPQAVVAADRDMGGSSAPASA